MKLDIEAIFVFLVFLFCLGNMLILMLMYFDVLTK